MKIVCTTSVLVALLNKSVFGSDGTFRPLKVSYDDLIDESGSSESGLHAMMDELSGVGLISITNMPDSFRRTKKDTLTWTHRCAMESDATKEHTFSDGTVRRTMASHTVPGGIQSMKHGSGAACRAFDQASLEFRQEVDRITRAFASQVSAALPGASPLLETRDGFVFKSVHDVVDNGEHLEHFHSYQGSSVAKEPEADSTIEWHTDQGFFLVFTPGMMTASTTEDGPSDLLDETEGFYIELRDGTRTQVQLDRQDDLVIMLGDGVNQYVNPSLNGQKLRAVPHALSMPAHGKDTARVWYGRMVLPPASAVHPEHGETFGHLRQRLIEASTSSTKDEAVLSLGCSSASSAFTHARQLEESSCEEGTLMCWHRCMSLEEHGVSDEICAAQGLDVWCINPRGQLWDDTHGDWYPGCIDSETAPNATEYPRLPNYPRDNETCTKGYEEFVKTNAQQYDFNADLMEGGHLYWSVDGDTVDGMFSYNGLFGFTALGFAGFPGGNAMHGAIIIMATPSDTYSPVTGFDFNHSATVEEYIIDPHDTAFRHWMTPVTTAEGRSVSQPKTYAVEETDCFTSMTFQTSGIYNTTFNLTGSNKMIWAANGWDMFAGYHTKSRGVIDVEWATGKVTLDEEREALKEVETGHNATVADDHDHGDHEHDDHEHEEENTKNTTKAESHSGASTTISEVALVIATTGTFLALF